MTIDDPIDEDPITLAKKLNKKTVKNSSRQLNNKLNEFRPWDDKPDPCLSVKQKLNNASRKHVSH